MSDRTATRFAWALWTVSISLICVSIVLQAASFRGSRDADDVFTIFELLAFLAPATFGALIAAHHPRNAIGWLFILVSLTWVGGQPFAESFSQAVNPDFPTGWDWIIWGIQTVYNPVMLATVTFLFLLFPNGKLPARHWRPLAWLTAILGLWIGVDEAVTSDLLVDEPPIHNPARLYSADDIFRHTLVELGALALFAVVVLLSASLLFLRFRGASGIIRQQMKWFALPTILISIIIFGAMGLLLIGGDGYFSIVSGIVQVNLLAAAVLLPSCAGIAIVRHNLYDIDLIINRAIVYGAVSVSLGLAYAGMVVGGGSLLRSLTNESSPLVVAASTLLVAALFRPLRTITQNVVDRRFYRRKYDARRTLEDFAITARGAMDLEQLIAELTSIVSTTMQPEHISVQIHPRGALGGKQ